MFRKHLFPARHGDCLAFFVVLAVVVDEAKALGPRGKFDEFLFFALGYEIPGVEAPFLGENKRAARLAVEYALRKRCLNLYPVDVQVDFRRAVIRAEVGIVASVRGHLRGVDEFCPVAISETYKAVFQVPCHFDDKVPAVKIAHEPFHAKKEALAVHRDSVLP